jgi:hypothetical protein
MDMCVIGERFDQVVVYVSEVHGENVDPGGPSRRRVVGRL